MSTGPRSSHKIETRRRVRSAKNGVKEKARESGKPVLTPEAPTTRESAREQLLRTIKRHRPDVLVSLAANVLPLFSKFYRLDAEQHHLMHWWQLRDKNDEKGNRLRAATGGEIMPLFQLERELWRWAESYNLKEEWFLDYALQTLSLWCRYSQSEDFDWAYTQQEPHYSVVDVSSKFKFEYDPWDPKADTWKSFDVKITEEFVRYKHAYHSAMTVSWEPEKKNFARKKREDRHFEWTIDYQIPLEGKTKSKSEIARDAIRHSRLDFSTVEEALKSVASLVDWKLLPSMRGRPKKT